MNNLIFFLFYSLGYQSLLLAKIFIFLATVFPYIVVFVTLAYLGYKKVHPPKIFLAYVIAFGAWFVGWLLKLLVHSDRPFIALQNVSSLIPESGYAFPSSHATFFMPLAVAVYFLDRKAGYILMICALVIGIARVVVGVHFPGDILGGFALGALVAYFSHIIFYSLYDHFFP